MLGITLEFFVLEHHLKSVISHQLFDIGRLFVPLSRCVLSDKFIDESLIDFDIRIKSGLFALSDLDSLTLLAQSLFNLVFLIILISEWVICKN